MAPFLRLLLFLSLILPQIAVSAHAQAVGDSEEKVRRALGAPSIVRTAGDRTIWMYPDGTKVVLVGDVVAEYTASSGTTRYNVVAAPRSARKSAPESRHPSSCRRGSVEDMPELTGGAAFFMLVGGLVMVVCSVVYIVAAFTESILWGLGVLFVPFVSLVFLILHWDRVKKPFLISLLLGAPLMALGGVIQVVATTP